MEILIVGFTLFINLFTGYVVYRKNSHSVTNILLSLLSLCLGLWSVFNFLALSSGSELTRLFWVRAVMFITTPFGPLIFLLATVFPQTKLEISRKLLLFTIFLVVLTSVLAISPFMFTKLENLPNGSFNLTPGFAIIFYGIVLIGFMTWGFIRLIRKRLHSGGIMKNQLNFFLFGLIISFILMTLTNFIAVVIFKTIQLTFLGPTFTIILVGFIAYAIIKHRFLDIRLIVARTVAYSLLITVISIFYVAATFLIGSLFLGFTTQTNQLMIYMALSVVVALSFEKLRIFLEKITDKIFFKTHYDSNQLLSDLGHIMSSTIELHPLTSSILKIMIDEIKVTRGIFVLVDGENIYDINFEGFTTKPNLTYFQILPLLSQENILVFDELEEGDLKQLMRVMNISVSIILKVKDATIGLLLLGEKASGETYTEQDLKVISILGPEAAIAIQNAQSFDKIKKFNITLSQEVQKATSDLQQANTKLKELDKLKNDFVSVASHELRTPMTAIRSYVWMALNRSDVTLTEKMKRYLGRTLISTERLINLVNDMLNVSRIESGRVEIKPQVFDIQTLADDILTEVGPKAGEKKIKLAVIKTKIPQVFADLDKVHQVLLNLVGNALKFVPMEGAVTISFFSDGKMVEIAIKDNGVGISQDDLSRLFQKFGRLDNSYAAAATTGGTGLGLFISKSLIELMHGKIRAASEGQGKGTVFTFSLPAAVPEVLANAEIYTKKPIGEVKTLEPVKI